jgi:molybdate transport system substrate-binding protein
MKRLLAVFFIFLIHQAIAQKLTIAVSANAQYAMEELIKEFKKKEKIEIDLITGASGKLTTQIMQGAPFHMFFSADLNYPNQLFSKGYAVTKPQIYALGTLVAWTTKRDFKLSKDLKELKSETVQRIGIANPDVAPYGCESVKFLKTINLYDSVSSKLVVAESISQVNQYITSGSVDVGFTAKSIVVLPNMKNNGSWIELDSKYYEPIGQGVVLLKRGKEEVGKAAESFLDFVLSARGKEILIKNGYKIPR